MLSFASLPYTLHRAWSGGIGFFVIHPPQVYW